MKMINHMGKHTTSKMRPLTRKTRPPRLLPPRPQRILRIQLGLLRLPPLTPIQPIMRRTPRRSLIKLLSRIILILGRDLRRIIHNLALIPRHLHNRRYSVALTRRRVVLVLNHTQILPSPFPRPNNRRHTPHKRKVASATVLFSPRLAETCREPLVLPVPSCAVAADSPYVETREIRRRTPRRVAQARALRPPGPDPRPTRCRGLRSPLQSVSSRPSRLARVVQTVLRSMRCVCVCVCALRACRPRLQRSYSCILSVQRRAIPPSCRPCSTRCSAQRLGFFLFSLLPDSRGGLLLDRHARAVEMSCAAVSCLPDLAWLAGMQLPACRRGACRAARARGEVWYGWGCGGEVRRACGIALARPRGGGLLVVVAASRDWIVEVSCGGDGVLGIGVGVLESGFFGRCDSSAMLAGEVEVE